jgi:predicted NUDIX family phosphoesterase
VTENILVVPTKEFHALGKFIGFTRNVSHYLPTLYEKHGQFRPRNEVENDPSFKQIIPYCLFCVETPMGKEFFSYRRSKLVGEERLQGMRSIGIGGHIDEADADPDEGDVVEAAVSREIREELNIHLDVNYPGRCVGLVNDESDCVGAVHLGLVYVFNLPSKDCISLKDPALTEPEFVTHIQVLMNADHYERWSRVCAFYV